MVTLSRISVVVNGDIPMIYFLDVLNEQATWSDLEDARIWGSKVLSQNLVDCDDELSSLSRDLSFIRQQLSMLHFREKIAVNELDERLSSIRLAFVLESDDKKDFGSQSGFPGELPSLRAASSGSSPGAMVRCLRDTLLVQFALFLSDALAVRAEKKIARCEGLYRREISRNYRTRALLISEESSINENRNGSFEERWRKEVPLLAESDEATVRDLIRCEDFFVPTKAAKFCSDACRFNTFQIKKQFSNPDYLADKQRRYRNRKSKK